jgi:hypothetical protein
MKTSNLTTMILDYKDSADFTLATFTILGKNPPVLTSQEHKYAKE